MRPLWVTGVAIAFAVSGAVTAADAAEIRLAEQFSMGYLQFNVMKRDKLIEKYAAQRGLKDFKVSWQRFNGTKHEQASWKEIFFPEIAGLNGS